MKGRNIAWTSKQDTVAVAKALITELIPRWGIPSKISSDNGTPFVSAAIKELSIDLRQHCAYHPASAGAVERETVETATFLQANP